MGRALAKSVSLRVRSCIVRTTCLLMSNPAKISAECLTPILYVRDFAEAMNYYTEKLLFDRLWEWGIPPDFGAVRLGNVEIFFCLGGQGQPGTWLSIFVEDVDD